MLLNYLYHLDLCFLTVRQALERYLKRSMGMEKDEARKFLSALDKLPLDARVDADASGQRRGSNRSAGGAKRY